MWALLYWFRTVVLRRSIPFIGGLVLNESCNLNCSQCRVANREISDHSFDEAVDGLRQFYDVGIRSVFIEGGEPFFWKDGEKRIEDIITAARAMGFRVVSIYTNGTFPIVTSADTVFVSLDGLRETNDSLRGRGFDRIMANIDLSSHPNMIINFTINSLNRDEIGAFSEEIERHPNIRGVFFNFHTPYYGFDELFLDLPAKRTLISEILKLKKAGRKIVNSTACLKAAFRDDWKRPSGMWLVYADRKMYTCCRALGNDDACRNCGYLACPEVLSILKLRPSAIMSALQYVPMRRASVS